MDVVMTSEEMLGPPVSVCVRTGLAANHLTGVTLMYTPRWALLLMPLFARWMQPHRFSAYLCVRLPTARAFRRRQSLWQWVGMALLFGVPTLLIAEAMHVPPTSPSLPWLGIGMMGSAAIGLGIVTVTGRIVWAKLAADGSVRLKRVSPAWVAAMRARPSLERDGLLLAPRGTPGRPGRHERPDT